MPRQFGGGRRMDKEWRIGAPIDQQVTAIDETLLGAGVIGFTRAETILRCRSWVAAHFDGTQQAADRIDLTFGLGIFSTDAVAAGAASLPEPDSNAEYPWLWWGQMRLFATFAAAHGEAWGGLQQRLEVDTKAMRRVKPQQTLAWVVQSEQATGAPVTIVQFGSIRCLVGS